MTSRWLCLAVLLVAVSACSNNAVGTVGVGGSGGAPTGSGGVIAGSGGVTGAVGAGAVRGTGGASLGSGGDASGAGGAMATGGAGGAAGSGGTAATGPWVMGYWAVWQTTQYPLAHVAWSDMTHAAISFVAPRAPVATSSASPYATLDSSNAVDNLGATGMADFAAAAHAGGTHPIISLGGAGAGVGFAAAASPTNQKQLVSEIVAACAKWKYDGVDLDWEDNINLTDFQSLVLALRAAAPPGFLITAPVGAVNNNAGIDSGDRRVVEGRCRPPSTRST